MRFVFVDGYNVVNSWDILKKEKSISLESARQKLIDILDNYGAINGCKVILVFDGYKVAGNRESKYEYNKNLVVIFTKDGVTADAYIEKEVNHIGRKYEVHVVTSDSLEQQTIFQRGAVRISSIEFYNLVFNTNEDIKHNSKKVNSSDKNVLLDNIDDDVLKKLEAMRRS
ncbi:NYN domain-containing protein [Clostridium sp.]|uniref:NYN domain-containing protein n=1 Tax=Clostridium sp. TaxID=1506 RepID=UPI00267247CD|nr:NYN domain-containing protein [Clostridium sp.]MEE0566685.1 NYN domain-containing protein [Clostridium sp.]